MLPDFALPMPIATGQRLLIARDVPAAVFFLGIPEALAGAHAAATRWDVTLAFERWLDELLARVVVMPQLTIADVRRLGDLRSRPALAYLRTIGWLPDRDPAVTAWRGDKAPAAASWPLEASVTPPPANLRAVIRSLAESTHLLPAAIWALPISEWILSSRVLLADEDTAVVEERHA